METFKNSPDQNLNPLTSSAAGSRAKTSATPESGRDSQALAAAFGLSSPVSLGSFDHDGLSLRTSQGCLLCQEQWGESLETLPASGMWDAGDVYALQTSAPATCESGCSLWPTASGSVANDGETQESWEARKRRNLEKHCNGNGMGTPLTIAATCWPTARQEDGESCGNHPGAVDSLTGAAKQWPTPMSVPESTASHNQLSGQFRRKMGEALELWQPPATDSFRSRGGDRKDEQGLDQQARFWPTISANEIPRLKRDTITDRVSDWDASLPDPQTPDGPASSESAPISRRRLNPRFVEWLMGFPVSWTER